MSQFPLEIAVEEFGSQVACIDGQQRHTYSELFDGTSNTMRALMDAGVEHGDHVCFVPSSNWPTLQMLWAILGLGAVACPISDRLPDETRKKAIQDFGAKRFFDVESILSLIESATSRLPRHDWSDKSDDRPATLMLTSGTTEIPKAVLHDLRAHIVSARGSNENISLGPGDRWLWSLPSYHVSGLSILFRCALAGAAVVTMKGHSGMDAAISQNRITHLSVVATQLKRLLAEKGSPTACLKAVLLGGGALPVKLIERAWDAGVPLHTTYGLTEMASQVTTTKADSPERRRFTAGRVLPGRELCISASGEILVRGQTLCRGYYRGGTVEPVVDNNGWFHTGDLGYLEGEYLTVTGRMDNMFISGGENIHPEEIEKWLLDIDGVRQAVVVSVPDPDFGHRPVAFVDAESLNVEWIQEYLGERLPSFKIPCGIHNWPHHVVVNGIKTSRAALAEFARSSVDMRLC